MRCFNWGRFTGRSRGDKMYTVTFYSYTGGVGRTLALMNTAFRLSKKGKTVFVLDFDLEAPGVDVFSSAPRASGDY